MNSINRTFRVLLVVSLYLALLGAVSTAHAMDAIAKVIVSVGKVEALSADGDIRPLKRRSAVFNTDTVMTSEGSKVQLRFTDGSMLALKPDSRFAIESYQYQAGDDDGKAVYNLLKGGMQTITGAIGRKNKENYALKTPTATIGIRGTYYQLKACQGDCFNGAGEPEADGLYGGVKGGAINITNKSGSYVINVGQYFYMAGPDAPVVMLDKPPAILGAVEGSKEGKRKPASTTAGAGSPPRPKVGATEGSATGDSSAPDLPLRDSASAPQPVTGDSSGSKEPPPPTVFDPTPTGYDPIGGGAPKDEETLNIISLEPIGVAVPDGGSFGVAFSAENGRGEVSRAAGLFTLGASHKAYFETSALSFLEIDDAGCVVCQLESGSSFPVDSGGYGSLGVRWGRWQGDYSVIENGQPLSPELGGLHYIYSPDITSRGVVDGFGGLAKFDFFGGTPPTDNAGHVGEVDSSRSYLVVDFDRQVFDSASLGFHLNGQNYLVLNSDEAPLGSLLNTGIALSGSGLSGEMLTQFVGAEGKSISGVYNLSNASSIINGTGLFLRADRLSVTPVGSLAPAGGVLASAYTRLDGNGVYNTAANTFSLSNAQEIFLNSASVPTYIETLNTGECNVCQFVAADATLVDVGRHDSLDVTWGRWVGDYVVGQDGFELSGLSDNYHFIYSAQLASLADVKNTIGLATFDYVGGTNPTDQFGNVGVIDAAASYVDFDFYKQAFTSVSYRFTLGGSVFQLNSTVPVELEGTVGADIPLQGSNLTGSFGAQLLGFNGTGISGVYSLSGSGLEVSATGLFQRANRLDITPTGAPLTAGGLGIVTSIKGADQTIDHVNDQFTVDAHHRIYVNDASAPTYIEKTTGSRCVVCQFSAEGASYQDVGSSATTGSYWGRWQGDFTVAENGLMFEPLGDQLHYIGNTQVTSYSALQAQTGSASFKYSGGTSPTDQLGNLGSVQAATSNVKVDFDAQLFSEVNLGLMLGGASYQLSNDIKVSFDSDLSSKIPISGNGLSGDFSAQFVGSGADGVNASYHVGSSQTSITGVAAFVREAAVVEVPRIPDGCAGCEMETPM